MITTPTFRRALTTLFAAAFAAAPALARSRPGEDRTFRAEVSAYLAAYGATYQRLYTEWIDARLDAGVYLDPAETRARRVATELALVGFTGSIENIELSRAYAKRDKELPAVARRELARIAFLATASPRIVPDLVERRVQSDVEARDVLAKFPYVLDGGRTTLSEIARTLSNSDDLATRRAAWESAQAVGTELREIVNRRRWLQNECVRAMGERDFFDHRAEESGMGPAEILRRSDEMLRDLRGLQTELHTWVRHELARRYAQPVPDLIPAHWLAERFGQDWSSALRDDEVWVHVAPAGTGSAAVPIRGATDPLPGDPFATPREGNSAPESGIAQGEQVEGAQGARLDGALDPRTLVGAADAYFTSLGFRPMPASSWNLSTFVALAPGAGVRDAFEPDAWHVDLDREVRWNLALEPGIAGFAEALRALGRSHADVATANSDVPVVLRHGSTVLRFAVGDLAAWSGTRPGSMAAAGFVRLTPEGHRTEAREPEDRVPDSMRRLLAEALDTFAFVPFGAGTVLQFEKEIYRDELPVDRWNARFWQLAARYQGIAPPSARDERWCDPLAQPQIVLEPATYFQRAFARVLAYQLNDHVARKILDLDPRTAEFQGRREVGDFLRSLLRFGGSVDWRAKLRERVGADLSARALLDYFEPLRAWLEVENRGRRDTLPPL